MSSRYLIYRMPLLVLYLAITLLRPPSSVPILDEAEYLEFAAHLTQGYYSPSHPSEVDLWFGPGLPVVLAPFVALGLPLSAIRIVGPLLLFATVLVFEQLMAFYVRPRMALLCACVLGLYFPLFVLLRTVHSEPLVLLMIVTTMYASVRNLRQGQRRFLVLAGISLGWVALTRVAFGWVITLVLVVLVIGSLIWRRQVAFRRFALIYAIGLLTCVPWLLYTYSLTDRFFYWGNSGGLSLYWMSSTDPRNEGDWFSYRAVFTRAELAVHRPLFQQLDGLHPVARDVALQSAALDNIRSNPLNYLQNVAANISRLWFSFPFSFTPQKLTTLFYLIPNGLLLAALTFCVPVLLLQRRNVEPEVISFSLFALVAFGVHALLSAYARMLMPLIPVMLWLIVYTLTTHVRISFPAGPKIARLTDA